MNSKLFLALDQDTEREALNLVEQTHEFVKGYKIGPSLFLKLGPSIVKEVSKFKPVFLDMKHFDIPNTVEKAVLSAFEIGVRWMTLHALNGKACMKNLKPLITELQKKREFEVLWVTVLTSFSGNDISKKVLTLAENCAEEGFLSFVCSGLEVESLRQKFPNSFLVTPGVRFQDSAQDDQKRVITPQEALKKGASAVVVGRPIYQSHNPRQMAQKFYEALS